MKIACLLDAGFEDSEFQDPYQSFRDAGHQVVLVGKQAHQPLTGNRGRVTIGSERGIDEVRPQDSDALFLPGGSSPDHLRADPRVVEFTREFADSEKPVLAICHGPQLLLSADRVRGRTMTAWRTVQGDIGHAGANVVDQPVAVDGVLVTSRQPSDIPAFVEASLRLLRG